MGRALNTQILVVGRKFPVLPFERALVASGIPDYLCVDTLEAAEMLRTDGFRPDIVIVDAELLGTHAKASFRSNRNAVYVVIENDLEDFEDVLVEELADAINQKSAKPELYNAYKPIDRPTDTVSSNTLFLG